MTIDFHTHIFPEKIAAKTIAKLETKADVKAYANGREESLLPFGPLLGGENGTALLRTGP